MGHKKYQYPIRANSRYKLLVDGNCYYPEMLAAINNANSFILFESYLFESGKVSDTFIEALKQARKRDVEIYLLLDDYGALNLVDSDKDIIRASGINLLLYNTFRFSAIQKYLKRDHRKLLITDYTYVFIGGAGITDEFSPEHNTLYWHDSILRVEGKIIDDFIDSFSRLWKKNSEIEINIPGGTNYAITQNNKARLLLSQRADQNEITRTLVKRIRSSKERVWLTSPYFITSIKVRRVLKLAARSGIDVRLLFPGQHSDHKWVTHGIHRYYHRLLKSGVRIFEYQPRFTHSKIILVDHWFTIGSSNIDKWNQYLNLDINIEIEDRNGCESIVNYFNYDFSQSREVFIEQWKKRSAWKKFIEGLTGIAIYLLAKISHKYRR